MAGFETVRIAAAALRSLLGDADRIDAPTLVRAAARVRGITIRAVPADDVELEGALGLLDRRFGEILHSAALTEEMMAEVVAHELGHLELHDGPEAGFRQPSAEEGDDAARRIETYGIKERREAQANAFSREFLLPRASARRQFVEGGTASGIAARLKVRYETVLQQLADGILLPDVPQKPVGTSEPRPLNASQRRAACHRGTPFLLNAGPGTGKTRTLVSRISGLLAEGVPAGEILALTFSNKAAQELATRVDDEVPGAAVNLWTGTFHAFGLETIRKQHSLFGLGPDPAVIDATRAVEMLEEELPALDLVHHVNLIEPAMALRDLLRAISRAKDELRSPDDYRRLADGMARVAATDEEVLAAEKAGEVATVYAHYEGRLRELRAVDYGDLIMMPTLMMQSDTDFRNLMRARFKWIHVDEYQDVNRASAMLVKQLAGDGGRLWVVGDARQSMYRFRGASAANIARFEQDYPGGVRDGLSLNYRSSDEIVRVFRSFGATMRVTRYGGSAHLEAERGSTGVSARLVEVGDEVAEMDALAAAIRDLERAGVKLGDQAVLARSNGALGRAAQELEARGVPVLYLGPIFDREEVRDLLSLLSLATDRIGSSLLRVAAFPEYAVPLEDVRLVIDDAVERGDRVIDALRRVERLALSPRGAAGLRLLAHHLADTIQGTTPWLLVGRYLFDRSDYVRTVLSGQSISDQMRRVAVRQLIDCLRTMPSSGRGTPIRRALDRIRSMILLADERDLRQLPPELDGLEGVRMMTVHASKGLEFDAVHAPWMHAGAMPATNRPQACPPPAGLIEHGDDEDAHEAEEECVLFVAMSRARSHLTLYRSRSRNGRNSNPSRFLERVPLTVDQSSPRIAATNPTKVATSPILRPSAPEELSAADVDAYHACPRRFLYDRVLGARGWTKAGAHLDAHGCVQAVLRHVRSVPRGVAYDRGAGDLVLESAWTASALEGHPYGRRYRSLVSTMVERLHLVAAEGSPPPAGIVTRIGPENVSVTFDRLIGAGGGVVARSFRSGRGSSADADRLSATIALKAAAETLGHGVRLETHYLASGRTFDVAQTAAKRSKRLADCEAAVRGIRSGTYPAAPDDFKCPRCPHLFACPAPSSED